MHREQKITPIGFHIHFTAKANNIPHLDEQAVNCFAGDSYYGNFNCQNGLSPWYFRAMSFC